MSTDVKLLPITSNELQSVAAFLTANLNAKVPARVWESGMQTSWAQGPDYGYMLTDADQVVGANLAFRSVRVVRGRPEQICNLGALCVLPEYRAHAPRLIRAILRTPGISYTDLSPSGNVVEINQRLKMSMLCAETRLIANLPRRQKNVTITTDDRDFRQHLEGQDLTIYVDHAAAPAVRHLLLVADGRACHVMLRPDRRKGLRVFATILYVSDRELFQRFARALLSHVLLKERLPFTLLEDRIACAGVLSWKLSGYRPKMYKSATLGPEQIDYLYSELTQIPW